MLTASLVLYHNSKKDVDTIVKCVLNSSIDKLYIIDNSRNDAFRILEKRSNRIRYIHNENIGYGGAHNIAIREAIEDGARYHIVVNPDIYFDDGTVEALVEYMDCNPDVGWAMPRVVYPNGDLQYLCKLLPTPFDLIFRRFIPKQWFKSNREIFKRFLPSSLIKNSLHRFQLRFTGYDKIMNVPYLSGCFMFFRVSALQEIGLFDERFFMYPEDIDITRRMHERYKTIFYPNISIIHAHAAASKANLKMLKVHILNMIKYFNKWGWVFDKKRKQINQKLLKELNYHK